MIRRNDTKRTHLVISIDKALVEGFGVDVHDDERAQDDHDAHHATQRHLQQN